MVQKRGPSVFPIAPPTVLGDDLRLSPSTVGSSDWFQEWLGTKARPFPQSLFQPYSEPEPKGPFRTKNAIAMEIVVVCYRGSILLSVPIRCHFAQEKNIQTTIGVVNYYHGSESLSP